MLDLNTIRQQTVDRLGKALNVSRCILCPYKSISSQVRVVAEYCRESDASMLGQFLEVADDPAIAQALATTEPVVVGQTHANDRFGGQSAIVVATRDRQQLNSLIVVYAADSLHQWSEAEIEMVRKVAEQTGIAIADAALYQELQEAREQAQEASRLKSEFLGTINHELRTPLNKIIGSLKLILDDIMEDPQEQREFIHYAHHSAIGLRDIINDILAIGKLKTTSVNLDLEPVNLTELLSEVERFMQSQAQQKNLKLIIQKPTGRTPIILHGNYRELLEVMLNLVGNAIKFTPQGGIDISAKVIKQKVRQSDRELPGMVEIRITDTGIGVPLEKRDRLFQPFSKVNGSTTSPYGGIGLGLAISQQLVEAMGGEMEFFSMGEGLGSTVIFNIPLYQEPLMLSPNRVIANAKSSRYTNACAKGDRIC